MKRNSKKPPRRRKKPDISGQLGQLIERLDELVGGVNALVARQTRALPQQPPPEPGNGQPQLQTANGEDPFTSGRSFRIAHDRIVPMNTQHIRPPEDLYGYRSEKRFFGDYFRRFAAGERMPPLLLFGLPGLGKTHFAIGFAMAQPELVLVTAEERCLGEPLEELVATLGRHSDRRFVLFFDDVNAEEIDWTHFRNQVGGYLPMPDNVTLVIASNYCFPGAIRSRCMAYEFKSMDPEVCRQMIEGYLRRRMDVPEPTPALVGAVACDYTNDYINGYLDDLTPRSLIRYLDEMRADPARYAKLVDEALMIHREPMEEAFLRSNQRTMEQMSRKGQWTGIRKVPPSI